MHKMVVALICIYSMYCYNLYRVHKIWGASKNLDLHDILIDAMFVLFLLSVFAIIFTFYTKSYKGIFIFTNATQNCAFI